MYLHDLESSKNKRRKRVGRGPGSGSGKNCGRGQNGAKSRSGYKRKRGFEGGQNPLYKRIPKRGFNNINTIEYDIINIQDLNRLSDVKEITLATFVEYNLIKNLNKKIKILGNGNLEVKLTSIEANKVSSSAQEKLEKAGVKLTLV